LKIIILQGAFLPVPPKMGGAVEKMWFALGKHFAAQGHEVVQVSRTYADMPIEEWIDGVLHRRVQGHATPSSGLRLKWLDLLYTLRSRSVIPVDADIVVANTFWAPIVLPAVLRRRCIPDVQRMPKGQMRFYSQAARLRANSTPVVEAICRELPANQHHRVVLIPNPLPFQNPPPLDLGAKKRVLLYAGRVHVEKGLELLLQAFKTLSTDWKLQIVGPAETSAGGSGTAYLESLKQLAKGINVEFTGPVYDMELLNQYYSEAAVFVYPSIAEQGETFGLAPLEAMAWGCVPIVSNLACFHDFIEHERNGLVFDHRRADAISLLGKAIERLLTDWGFRTELAQQALAVRESHSISFIASQFILEFERTISEQVSTKRNVS
jgi:glycosyltransferase involved in cell wall biosynthesis